MAALVVLTAYPEAGPTATSDVPEGGEPFNSALNPDTDVPALVALSVEAARRVEEEAPAAVLRQLNVSPDHGQPLSCSPTLRRPRRFQ